VSLSTYWKVNVASLKLVTFVAMMNPMMNPAMMQQMMQMMQGGMGGGGAAAGGQGGESLVVDHAEQSR